MWTSTLYLYLVCSIAYSSAFPQVSIDSSLVISSTSAPDKQNNDDKTEGTKADDNKGDEDIRVPKIYEMNVYSAVSNRFANTTITSKVKNLGKKAQEATFSVVLPDSAYITGFIMQIDGKNYTAYIKEKEEAKQIYDQAVNAGFGAAHVAASARDSNRFTVSVNVEPQSKAVFYLTYEELLKRKQHYDIVINIHPKQPVPNLNVEVFINETRPLDFVKTPPLRSGNDVSDPKGDLDSKADIKIDGNTATVKFSPSADKQKEYAQQLGTKENEGLSGQFVVQYDVKRDSSGGEILLKDGYFVHFFAPSEITPLPKHAIFVLDTSGSMYGTRIAQLKEAMKSILAELKNDQDVLSIVEFNSRITVWNPKQKSEQVKFPADNVNVYNENTDHKTEDIKFPEAALVNPDVIKTANDIVNSFNADGGTNIFDALKVAIQLVKNEKLKQGEKALQPMIIFLTDGEPTVGVSSTDKIISLLSEVNVGGVPIFSLSFGDGADRKFLQKLSLLNNGFSRHIYEASDASLQLRDFYKEISSPLLSNVTFKYTKEATELTKTVFPNYFKGGEIVICGAYDKPLTDITPKVNAWSVKGPIELIPHVEQPVGELERLWAYLTIQQLLESKEIAKNKTENEKKALELALKYKFVTPLTSLVVVKPNDTSAVDTEAADRTDEGPGVAYRNLYRAQPTSYSARGSPYMNRIYSRPSAFSGIQKYAMAGPPGPVRTFAPLAAFPAPQQFSSSSFQASYPIDRLAGGGSFDDDLTDIRFESAQVDSGLIPSTPAAFYPSTTTYRATSEPPTPSTTVEPSQIEKLLDVLTWLRKIYNAANESISLTEGLFKLAAEGTIDETIECNNPPSNTTGHCTLLQNCPKVHSILTSLDVYTHHFCHIENYAGVCCPV